MRCCDNCSCHLCRELAVGLVSNSISGGSDNNSNSNCSDSNFILRGRSNERYKSVIEIPGPSLQFQTNNW